ncbi:MAG: hypothetical protein OET81_02970 [Desulfobacteraceae bacterium]|nr:hypothetical protein [Desulfobacteraceae bacterium]MDH3573054.1 hypothetical protein [Desulfobacteraceae bacterium]MDH3722250.1 hypothetical protein [Desulfobacteraceae bacterium]MDH3874342.1 hypothetical protein [Desulfobacteraceae bacterium]MDH3881582.1 hypothetical protein [Desulfobacteraceae bacterium]
MNTQLARNGQEKIVDPVYPNVAKVEGEAVVVYRNPLTTQIEDPVNSGEMQYHAADAGRVNNKLIFR